MDIKILVATHKKYQMPAEPMYVPIHVGKEGKSDLGYTGDNTGENISYKNSRFNELTAIYWAWKNLEADYVGLVHYRRYFTAKTAIQCRRTKNLFELVANRTEMEERLRKHDVILPAKRHYYIETIFTHFIHLPYVFPEDLECLRQVMRELEPEYAPYLDFMLNRRWAHMFNMFVMKRELFIQYCEWLFPIMEEAEKRIDMTGRKPIEARFYISEFLMDTWIEKNHIPYEEMNVLFIERENFLKKGWVVLKRKIGINKNERKQYATN